MQMLDCDCGFTLQAGNDDDLFKVAKQHIDEEHGDRGLTDEQIRELIAERAYSAMDS